MQYKKQIFKIYYFKNVIPIVRQNSQSNIFLIFRPNHIRFIMLCYCFITIFSILYSLQYTLYNVQHSLYNINITLITMNSLNNLHCTTFIVEPTLYNIQCMCTVQAVHCKVYSVQPILYNLHCTLYSMHCTTYIVQSTMYNVQYTTYIV